MSTSPRIDPADSIGHSASYYRRQLLEAQNEIQRLRNALTLAQAEITTLRTERRNVEAQLQEAQATANEWQNAHEHAQFFAAQKQAVAS